MSNEEFKPKIPDYFLSRRPFSVDTKKRSYDVEFDKTDIIITYIDKYKVFIKRVNGSLEISSRQKFVSGNDLPDNLDSDMLKAAEIAVAMYDHDITKPAQELLDKETKRTGTSPENL